MRLGLGIGLGLGLTLTIPKWVSHEVSQKRRVRVSGLGLGLVGYG